nr:hypothetical protein [Tanacetum cinerariifolium]
EIRPIFQARFDANMRFLFKSREEMEEEDREVLKSINETPAQKAAKRRKLDEEAQEAKDLKKNLEPSIPAAAPTVVAAYTRRRKGVIIIDLEEELSSKTLAETPKLKDKGKEINKDHEEINKDIDWDAAIDHVKQKSKENPQYIKRYQVMKKRPQTETRFDANMRFLFKSREEMEEEDREVLKSINETPAQKAAKKRKLNEEAQEVEDLKKHLEVVNDEDDDVFIEATPLARKGRMIDDLDKDEGIELVVDQPSIPSAAPTSVAAYIKRRKGVIIRYPEEELSSKTFAETPKLKDKGKGILIETPKPMKKNDQIKLDAEYARKLHEEINRDHEEINKDID